MNLYPQASLAGGELQILKRALICDYQVIHMNMHFLLLTPHDFVRAYLAQVVLCHEEEKNYASYFAACSVLSNANHVHQS